MKHHVTLPVVIWADDHDEEHCMSDHEKQCNHLCHGEDNNWCGLFATSLDVTSDCETERCEQCVAATEARRGE